MELHFIVFSTSLLARVKDRSFFFGGGGWFIIVYIFLLLKSKSSTLTSPDWHSVTDVDYNQNLLHKQKNRKIMKKVEKISKMVLRISSAKDCELMLLNVQEISKNC